MCNVLKTICPVRDALIAISAVSRSRISPTITIFGAWYKDGNLIAKLERASHLAKDAGELCAALGAIMVFTLPFNEEMINKAFGVVFLGYFWGLLTGIILITVSNYLKTKEETIGPVQSSVSP